MTDSRPSDVGSPSSAASAGKSRSGKASGTAPAQSPADAAAAAAAAARALAAKTAQEAADDLPNQAMIRARRGDVQGRNAALAASLSSLHSTLGASTRDSAEVLQYLEHEVRRKDLVTKQLGRELRELHASQLAEKEQLKAKYAADIAHLEHTFTTAEQDLLDLNKLRHQEHADLLLFQRIRTDLIQELTNTKNTILRNEQRHALQMADLERKFLAARQRLLEESYARIAASRSAYKEEVGRELDLESEWLRKENEGLQRETEFHQVLMERLQKSNAELARMVAELDVQVRMLEQKDTAFASHSLRNTKLLQELTQKHAMLTAALAKARAEKEKHGKPQRLRLGAGSAPSTALTSAAAPPSPPPAQLDPSLLPLQSELDKLHALSDQKSRENAALRSQIALYRSQQTDVELCALDALARVKGEVCARRRREYEEQLIAYRKGLARITESVYQPRGVKLLHAAEESKSTHAGGLAATLQADPRVPEPVPPVTDVTKIKLHDLSLHNRERVLQLLFEQLHASATQDAPPPPAASSRPLSALSLYAGSTRPASATSLIASRPSSSTRTSVHSGPAPPPARSTAAARTRTRPLQPLDATLTPADMRPSEYAQLSGMGDGSGVSGRGKAHGVRGQRGHERRSSHAQANPPFFPARGHTPTELL